MKNKKPPNETKSFTPTGHVIGKCIGCGHKKKYDLEQKRNFTMVCEKCFMPTTAVKVVRS